MSRNDRKGGGQIALPLAPLHTKNAARIVVGQANADAVAALGAAQDWPFRTAVLVGPKACGKSLLARWFVQHGLGDVVDDADRMDETQLFHRWNRAQQEARPLLLTATEREIYGENARENAREGGGWQIALPDLRSRLGAALWLRIGPPDDAMMQDLIAAHCEARGLAVGMEGWAYLASRGERSHLFAQQLVAAIDRLSLERKSAPGPAIWREALEELNGPDEPSLF